MVLIYEFKDVHLCVVERHKRNRIAGCETKLRIIKCKQACRDPPERHRRTMCLCKHDALTLYLLIRCVQNTFHRDYHYDNLVPMSVMENASFNPELSIPEGMITHQFL